MARLTIRIRNIEGDDQQGHTVGVKLKGDDLAICSFPGGSVDPHITIPNEVVKTTDESGQVHFELNASAGYLPDARDYVVRVQADKTNAKPDLERTITMPNADTTLYHILTEND